MDTTGKSNSRIGQNQLEDDADTSGTQVLKNESLIDKSYSKIEQQLSMDKRESRKESMLIGSDRGAELQDNLRDMTYEFEESPNMSNFIKIEEGRNSSSSSSHKIESWKAEVSNEQIEKTPSQ